MNKWLNSLGLAKKAGKVVISLKLEESIKKGKVVLVIIAENSSVNSLKKWKNKCSYYDVTYLVKGTKQELGFSIGKDQVSAVGITSNDFAKLINLKIKEGENGGKE